jgi:hypothetical protein
MLLCVLGFVYSFNRNRLTGDGLWLDSGECALIVGGFWMSDEEQKGLRHAFLLRIVCDSSVRTWEAWTCGSCKGNAQVTAEVSSPNLCLHDTS